MVLTLWFILWYLITMNAYFIDFNFKALTLLITLHCFQIAPDTLLINVSHTFGIEGVGGMALDAYSITPSSFILISRIVHLKLKSSAFTELRLNIDIVMILIPSLIILLRRML